MFGIGPLEIAVILVFALIFVGPQKLPHLAQQLGRFFVQMKRMSSDVRSTVDEYMLQAERDILKEEQAKFKALIQSEVLDPVRNLDQTSSEARNSTVNEASTSEPSSTSLGSQPTAAPQALAKNDFFDEPETKPEDSKPDKALDAGPSS